MLKKIILILFQIMFFSIYFILSRLERLDSRMESRNPFVKFFRPAHKLSNVIFFVWFAIWYLIDVDSKANIGHQDISTLLCFVFLFQDGTSKPVPFIMAVNIEKVRRIYKIVLAPLIVFFGL